MGKIKQRLLKLRHDAGEKIGRVVKGGVRTAMRLSGHPVASNHVVSGATGEVAGEVVENIIQEGDVIDGLKQAKVELQEKSGVNTENLVGTAVSGAVTRTTGMDGLGDAAGKFAGGAARDTVGTVGNQIGAVQKVGAEAVRPAGVNRAKQMVSGLPKAAAPDGGDANRVSHTCITYAPGCSPKELAKKAKGETVSIKKPPKLPAA
jgi:hypothetical protein